MPAAKRKGAVLTEFVIVFPILFISIVGIIEFGRAVMIQQIVTNAAREGARRAIVPETSNDDVTELVDTYLINSSLGVDSRQIQILGEDGSPLDLSVAPPHSLVDVRVSVAYNDAGFGVFSWFSDSILGAAVRMRKE